MFRRFVGVTVLPEYIQSESIDGVLDNLVHKAGANAVATSPYLMEEAPPPIGRREPPSDAGAGGVRLLDRPLWGKRELFVRTAPSFEPDRSLYRGLKYQPSEPDDLTRRQGHLLRDFIRAAQARHLKVYLQVQAAIPPGYRVQFGGPDEDDQPRLPEGRPPTGRLANNGSLASPRILDYAHALIKDLCRAYPDVDGLRFDWPEYPPYQFDDLFLDFGDHARAAAGRLGFDFEAIRRAAAGLRAKLLGSLTDADIAPWLEPDGGRFGLLRELADRPALGDWIRFKATLVERMLAGFRRAMDEAGGTRMELMPNAFPPPWTIASGLDFARAGRHASAISVKLYTMHWPLMIRFYADALRAANPGLSDGLLARALVRWLDVDDGDGLPSCDDYHYPGPDEPHTVGTKALVRKIAEARRRSGTTPIYALAHGYGPIDDYRRRLGAAFKASPDGLWMNRYGYLTDEKLEILRLLARS